MEGYLVWLILGLLLITIEMMTGTFYLLVLGLAALTASALGYFGGSAATQAVFASIVAVIGVFAVNRWRRNNKSLPKSMDNNMDLGQPVIFEAWTNQPARLVRVKYRGTSWDAHLLDGDAEAAGVLYICGAEGSRLQVSAAKPS
ncbi:MAG: hypothetical protein H0U63_08345 [Burkholderiales bacterium]|nr:hypothetical protein [Burkholderiales bacterium]